MKAIQPILVIDDDEGIREFVSMTLADEGYPVLTAADGIEGLELAQQCRPCLILLDMRMPLMDGGTFVRSYRASHGPHAPVILLTAARNAEDSARQVLADDFLAKPFELDSLLEMVGRYLRVQPAAD